MKKILIFISLIIICLICSIILIVVKNNSKYNYQIEEVKEINYVVFRENNKFGVINKKGEVVVQPRYDIVQIPNPSKPLFICKYNYDADKNQYSIKVFNDKAEQILYQYVIVEAIELNSVISPIPYEKSVLKYMNDGKYGLIDFSGKVIVKAKYEEISSFDYNEGLLLVKEKGKYGIININGAIVVKPKYDQILSDGYYESASGYKKSGYIVGKKDGDSYKYGYINFKRKKVLDCKYEQIARVPNKNGDNDIYLMAIQNNKVGFYKNNKCLIKHEYEDMIYDENNNCLIVQKDSKQGIADLNGNITIDINYDNIYISGKYINAQNQDKIDIYDYSNKQKIELENVIGLNETSNEKYSIAIMNNEKFRILNNSENKLSENEYGYLEYLYDDCFITFTNNKFGVIDAEGNRIIDCKYDTIRRIGNTKMIQAEDFKRNTKEVFLHDKSLFKNDNFDINTNDNYIIIQTDSDRKYFDYEGNEVKLSSIENKQLYAANQNNKWGFEDKEGNTVIEPKYDFVTEFNEYGFAGIKLNGKWGVINSEGKIIQEPVYSIDSNNPRFIGKYYENSLGYGELYYISEITD